MLKRVFFLLLVSLIFLITRGVHTNTVELVELKDSITYERNIETVFVTSPAALPDYYALRNGLDNLRSYGLNVITGKSCNAYLSAREKADELMQAFRNPEVDLILTSRGGFGSFELLDYLNWEIIRDNPKPLVGYSDITALLLALHFKSGLITYHGPMVSVEIDDEAGLIEQMISVVEGKKVIRFDYPSEAIVPGDMVGKLIVGNLSLFKTLQGTEYIGSLRNCILVLEDIGETLHSFERMIWNIAHLEKYNELRGIVFAGFSNIRNGDLSELKKTIRNYFASSDIPVWLGLPVYHDSLDKLTLPVGSWVKMELDEGKITIIESYK
ncbi:MAG: LD-carboxypeptidase [Kosmotoga sp.]|nr:MAG: LD-carboxypeptidase [Kosmotoga sp.]